MKTTSKSIRVFNPEYIFISNMEGKITHCEKITTKGILLTSVIWLN
jgi:hypothetical protein